MGLAVGTMHTDGSIMHPAKVFQIYYHINVTKTVQINKQNYILCYNFTCHHCFDQQLITINLQFSAI